MSLGVTNRRRFCHFCRQCAEFLLSKFQLYCLWNWCLLLLAAKNTWSMLSEPVKDVVYGDNNGDETMHPHIAMVSNQCLNIRVDHDELPSAR